jgi:tetratricopeptide (TPR) repeat protein
MNKIVSLVVLLCFSLFFARVQAQAVTDEQLAAHYYQAGEFDKAELYYEKLYNKEPSDFYYQYLLKCYEKQEDYKTAKKLIQKQSKQSPNSLNYKVDMGYILKKEGDNKKGDKEFDNAIQQLPPSPDVILNLSNSFLNIDEKDYALKSLQQGKKLIEGYPFNLEIAAILASKGDYDGMVNEYLGMLDINEGYLQQVQNALAVSMSFEKDSKANVALKNALLKNSQKYPSKRIYSEMLIWVFIQEEDFETALFHSKSLDKRNSEQGDRILSLASLAHNNKKFDVAAEALEYMIAKGSHSFYYIKSKLMYMDVLKDKIMSDYNYSSNDLQKLESLYLATISEIGKNDKTVSLMKDLAHLQAFYLNNADSAIALLQHALTIPRITPQLLAECKIELADIYITIDEIWEASLLYSQVTHAFKYDHLGEVSKFKNAKISYFTGDFNWAKAQLDVLKGSTTKLIANDAMELSLLITDNSTIDTTTTPLYIFAQAELMLLQNKIPETIELLDSITKNYPGHSLEDNILFVKYKIAFKQKKYSDAAGFLEEIIQRYSYDLLADDSAFLLAELYERKLNNKEKAQEYYKRILTEHPDSIYVVEARKRFRDLRGDSLN